MTTALARITWLDLVRQELGQINGEEAEYILWEETAFPFLGADGIRQQLREFKARSSGQHDTYHRKEHVA